MSQPVLAPRGCANFACVNASSYALILHDFAVPNHPAIATLGQHLASQGVGSLACSMPSLEQPVTVQALTDIWDWMHGNLYMPQIAIAYNSAVLALPLVSWKQARTMVLAYPYEGDILAAKTNQDLFTEAHIHVPAKDGHWQLSGQAAKKSAKGMESLPWKKSLTVNEKISEGNRAGSMVLHAKQSDDDFSNNTRLANLIASWIAMHLPAGQLTHNPLADESSDAIATLVDDKVEIVASEGRMLVGAGNSDSERLLLASLAHATVEQVRNFAAKNKWELYGCRVQVRASDSGLSGDKAQLQVIREISFGKEVDEVQKNNLHKALSEHIHLLGIQVKAITRIR